MCFCLVYTEELGKNDFIEKDYIKMDLLSIKYHLSPKSELFEAKYWNRSNVQNLNMAKNHPPVPEYYATFEL